MRPAYAFSILGMFSIACGLSLEGVAPTLDPQGDGGPLVAKDSGVLAMDAQPIEKDAPTFADAPMEAEASVSVFTYDPENTSESFSASAADFPSATTEIDTTDLILNPANTTVKFENKSGVAILTVNTFAPAGALRITGNRPLIILANSVTVSQAIHANGILNVGGPGVSTAGIGVSGNSAFEGGGGGGHATDGADGAANANSGASMFTSTTFRLQNGGTGGNGDKGGTGGAGGGALQISSKGPMKITAQINVGGGGGTGGVGANKDADRGSGGGGGAGGTLLLEAPELVVGGAGFLASNGGGGGGGGSNPSQLTIGSIDVQAIDIA
jgi:hypothetical protein